MAGVPKFGCRDNTCELSQEARTALLSRPGDCDTVNLPPARPPATWSGTASSTVLRHADRASCRRQSTYRAPDFSEISASTRLTLVGRATVQKSSRGRIKADMGTTPGALRSPYHLMPLEQIRVTAATRPPCRIDGRRGTTIYWSETDRALAISRAIHKDIRLGGGGVGSQVLYRRDRCDPDRRHGAKGLADLEVVQCS